MNQSKKLTEGALYTAIFIVLMAITILMPGAILLFPLLLPIPFIIYAHKYDWQASLLMFAVALMMSFMVLPVFSIPLTVLSASGGIIIGSAMYRKRPAYEVWISGTSGFIGGLLFVFLFTQVILDINWAAQLDQLFIDSLEMSKQMMNQLGMGQQLDESLMLVEKSIEQMKNLIPVGIAILAITMAFLSQWVSYKLLNRIERTTFKFPAFRDLSFPVAIIWIYLLSLILIMFASDTEGVLFIAANNVQSLVGLLMILQGLSFMFFYSHYKKWPKAIPILGVVVTVILPFLFFYLIGILGLIDLGFGLRGRISKKKKIN